MLLAVEILYMLYVYDVCQWNWEKQINTIHHDFHIPAASASLSYLKNVSLTPRKTNMSPENQFWKMYFLLKHSFFRGHVSFRGCMDWCVVETFNLRIFVSVFHVTIMLFLNTFRGKMVGKPLGWWPLNNHLLCPNPLLKGSLGVLNSGPGPSI